jgi:hypothetical protein
MQRRGWWFGYTLYLALFDVFFLVLRTTHSTFVADFGGVGRPSSVQINLAPRTFVAQVGLNMLKWLNQL